jgi:hypothetical protein
MILTGIGNPLVDFLLKPVFKESLKYPELVLMLICLGYGYIAYLCIKSAYGVQE